MDFQEQAITIQQVSQKLDVPKPTLRFWEKEFEGILVLLRTNGGQTCPQRSRHALHREALPRRTGLRGGRGSVDGRTDGIDLLAERVTQVVRLEVLRFFEREH